MVWLMVLGIAICSAAARARAQDATTSGAVSDKAGKVLTAFRLDFAMSESEDGKKINTRHYSMNLVPGYAPSNEIKIGTRVPVESKQGEMQYIDVGTNIWSRMTPQGDSFQLEVRADLSNIAPTAEQENRPSPGPLVANAPLVRQVRINASTVATPGKPTVIGAVEDPNSKRQFQLEVTVTQLK
jgi:hypothetical protein